MSEMQADKLAELRTSGDRRPAEAAPPYMLHEHGFGWTRLSRYDDGLPLWVRWQDIIMVTRGDEGTTIGLRGCPQMVAVRESVKDVLAIVRHPRDGR